MHCVNCGKEITEGTKFCGGCGAPVDTPVNNNQQTNSSQAPAQGAKDNKVIFILTYLIFFLPLIACPESKEGRFHANQGLVLLLASVAGSIAISILSVILFFIPVLGALLSSLLWLAFSVASIALVVIGMINANKGLQKPLPVIGKIRIIK